MQIGTDIFGNIGVKLKKLYRGCHFVSDDLSGTVIPVPEFKVVNGVVGSVSVFVMDGFNGQQGSTDVSFHDKPMLEHLTSGISVGSRNSQNNVAALNAARHLRKSVFLAVDLADPLVFALPAAKQLSAVDVTAAAFSGAGKGRSAVLAGNGVTGVGICFAAGISASATAVSGVFAKFLSIFSQVSRLVGERRAALLAGKFNHRDLCRDTAMNRFMRGNAGFRAEPLEGLTFASDRESRSALFAGFFGTMGFARNVSAVGAAIALMALRRLNAELSSALIAILGNRHFSAILHGLAESIMECRDVNVNTKWRITHAYS